MYGIGDAVFDVRQGMDKREDRQRRQEREDYSLERAKQQDRYGLEDRDRRMKREDFSFKKVQRDDAYQQENRPMDREKRKLELDQMRSKAEKENLGEAWDYLRMGDKDKALAAYNKRGATIKDLSYDKDRDLVVVTQDDGETLAFKGQMVDMILGRKGQSQKWNQRNGVMWEEGSGKYRVLPDVVKKTGKNKEPAAVSTFKFLKSLPGFKGKGDQEIWDSINKSDKTNAISGIYESLLTASKSNRALRKKSNEELRILAEETYQSIRENQYPENKGYGLPEQQGAQQQPTKPAGRFDPATGSFTMY